MSTETQEKVEAPATTAVDTPDPNPAEVILPVEQKLALEKARLRVSIASERAVVAKEKVEQATQELKRLEVDYADKVRLHTAEATNAQTAHDAATQTFQKLRDEYGHAFVGFLQAQGVKEPAQYQVQMDESGATITRIVDPKKLPGPPG